MTLKDALPILQQIDADPSLPWQYFYCGHWFDADELHAPLFRAFYHDIRIKPCEFPPLPLGHEWHCPQEEEMLPPEVYGWKFRPAVKAEIGWDKIRCPGWVWSSIASQWETSTNGICMTPSYPLALPRDTPFPLVLQKPWSMPPPPAGMQWQRGDYTEEMLPEGWRPLLLGEIRQGGDEYLLGSEAVVVPVANWEITAVKAAYPHYRTRRPLPEPPKIVPLEANDWIENGPWWVRTKTGEKDYLSGIGLVGFASPGIISVATHPGPRMLSHRAASELLERSRTGRDDDWHPCEKEEG